ncbi:MAG: DNA-binding response OmpR family regulator, partial [Kiritimatiellia bacterium]
MEIMAEQLKILVVEDESDIQELLRYNLASDGYEVATVDTGEQGLSQVLQFKPHLILLDLMLPGLGGLEVCKRLKGDPATRDAKVIMLTARGEEADVVLGLEAGADDYI